MKKIMVLFLFGLVTPVRAADAPAVAKDDASATAEVRREARLDKIAAGTGVDQRELTGEAKEFPSTVERVYVWTRVSGLNPPAEIKHVWYCDGKKEAEVTLTLNVESGRTWSNKTVRAGKWKVEVLGSAGEGELGMTEFTVQP